tara:strand:+ start:3652 stop:3864 length:213 start_codon:yes stop_codon:yes gene_type:complete
MTEKIDKRIVLVVQPSLYDSFKEACEVEYKTISEVLRDFMYQYSKEHKHNEMTIEGQLREQKRAKKIDKR